MGKLNQIKSAMEKQYQYELDDSKIKDDKILIGLADRTQDTDIVIKPSKRNKNIFEVTVSSNDGFVTGSKRVSMKDLKKYNTKKCRVKEIYPQTYAEGQFVSLSCSETESVFVKDGDKEFNKIADMIDIKSKKLRGYAKKRINLIKDKLL